MTFATSFTAAFGLNHPIVLAPMCGPSTGALAGAVAKSGGLGLIGVGAGSMFGPDWVREQYRIATLTARSDKIGLGFIGCMLSEDDASFRAALDLEPATIFLSFLEDFAPHIATVHQSGIPVICQVHTVEQAVRVVDAGADVICVQGCDAGGHGQQHLGASIMALVPQTRDLIGPDIPLLAAGGIADGRGLAAALALGADGALMGTRFVASIEANTPDRVKHRIVATRAGDTETVVSGVFDALGQFGFTAQFAQGRVLNDNETIIRFHRPVGETPYVPVQSDIDWYARGDDTVRAIWASSSSGLIGTIDTVDAIMKRTHGEATAALGINVVRG